MKFPEKLIHLIALRDTNQSRLSRETGIAQSAISDMTAGKRKPYMFQALRLARALKVSLDYLADDEQEEIPKPELTEDERAVIALYRDLGLERRDAARALALAAKETAAHLTSTPPPIRGETPGHPPGQAPDGGKFRRGPRGRKTN